MATEEYIREFNGQILGIIRLETNGDKAAVDFPSRVVLGYYRAKYDHTTDFYGRVLAKGDSLVSLIYKNKVG